MGPPAVAPNSFCLLSGVLGAKKPRASSFSLRRYSYTDPWNWLVPDRVVNVTTPSPDRPYSAGGETVTILNSATASCGNGRLRNSPDNCPAFPIWSPSKWNSVLALVLPFTEVFNNRPDPLPVGVELARLVAPFERLMKKAGLRCSARPTIRNWSTSRA